MAKLLVTLLVLGAAWLHAAESPGRAASKPKIYDYVGKDSSADGDAQMKAIYSKWFKIIDFADEGKYVRAKLKGIVPRPLIESGRMVEGKVRVIFIVTDRGDITKPFILRSTNPKLDATVLDAVRHWRGSPSRLNGVAIPSVFAQDFTFVRRRR